MIDERIGIQVGRVARLWVFEIVPVEDLFALGHITAQPGPLGRGDLFRPRFNVEKLISPARCKKLRSPGKEPGQALEQPVALLVIPAFAAEKSVGVGRKSAAAAKIWLARVAVACRAGGVA